MAKVDHNGSEKNWGKPYYVGGWNENDDDDKSLGGLMFPFEAALYYWHFCRYH